MRATATFPQSDPLGEALEYLRMSETAYYHSELAAPWGLVMPEDCPKFHFVTSGRCWLEIAGAGKHVIEAGDFVVIPQGMGHRLSSEPAAPSIEFGYLRCEKISQRYALFRKDGKGPVTTIICGDLNFKHPAARHLVALLPTVIHIRAQANHSIEWLNGTMRFMAVEARSLRPGSEAIVTRLADILVIQAIRYWIEHNPTEQKGWLAALHDTHLARALGLIHREPGKNWTVASLARAAALSRSAFSARFSASVGEPVMQYVTRWRMHVAEAKLLEGTKTVEEIAVELGYKSGAAFSRAFRRTAGVWPGSVKSATANARAMAEPAHRYLKSSRSKPKAAIA
jgi:AraC-like DNA-binding protein